MNLENLKSSYKSQNFEEVSKDVLMNMVAVNQHPILRGIRRQLIIESIGWLAFLALYYNLFDGHLRPVYWNILLILAVGLVMVHNLLGYRITNNPVNGSNLLESLRNYLKRMRRYSNVSISTRVLAIAMIFGFFLSTADFAGPRSYWIVFGMLLVLVIQIYLLHRMWSKRIRIITEKYRQFMVKDSE